MSVCRGFLFALYSQRTLRKTAQSRKNMHHESSALHLVTPHLLHYQSSKWLMHIWPRCANSSIHGSSTGVSQLYLEQHLQDGHFAHPRRRFTLSTSRWLRSFFLLASTGDETKSKTSEWYSILGFSSTMTRGDLHGWCRSNNLPREHWRPFLWSYRDRKWCRVNTQQPLLWLLVDTVDWAGKSQNYWNGLRKNVNEHSGVWVYTLKSLSEHSIHFLTPSRPKLQWRWKSKGRWLTEWNEVSPPGAPPLSPQLS